MLMNKTEKIVQLLKQKIENKTILEVACGTADFSLAASQYAKEIICIDIESGRLNDCIHEQENIHFEKMDASNMTFENEVFDTIILYNSLYHIHDQYDQIMGECKRVLKKSGEIIIIGTWKIDISLMIEKFDNQAEVLKEYCIVKIGKN